MELKKHNGLTIYYQIAEALSEQIKTGVYKTGDFLPTEKQLAAFFGVNRHTVRRAVENLIDQGLVNRIHGRGSRVISAPITYHIHHKTQFTENIFSLGLTPSVHGYGLHRSDRCAKNVWTSPDSASFPTSWPSKRPVPRRLLGVRKSTGKSTYRSCFIVPGDSPTQSLKDLAGKSVAFVDPASTSGGLVPTYIVKKETGKMPQEFFGKFTYASSHDAVEMAVKNKTVDAGADNDITYNKMLDKGL